MSGFLRRITRTASGVKCPVVHSLARLPYAPSPTLLELQQASTHPDTGMSLDGDPGRSDSPGPRIRAGKGSARERGGRLGDGPEDESGRDSPRPGQLETEPVHREPSGGRQGMTATSPGDLAVPDSGTRGNGASRDPVQWIPREIVSREEVAPGLSSSPSAAAFSLRGSPETVSGRKARPGKEGRGKPVEDESEGEARRAGTADGEAESREVHVHIGRIEVTAFPEPSPAEPRRRGKRPGPMSLDEYLAKRDGRSS